MVGIDPDEPGRIQDISHSSASTASYLVLFSFLFFTTSSLQAPYSKILTENVRANTLLSETRNGYRLWSSDPYGIKPPLSTKRAERGWVASHLTNLLDGLARGASRRNPTEETDGGGGDDAVMGLLNWTGGESGHEIFGVVLPWEKS